MADTLADKYILVLTQTPILSKRLSINIGHLLQTDAKASTYVSDVEKVSKAIVQLYNDLNFVKKVMDIVCVIPEVGEAAVAFKNELTLFLDLVRPVKEAMSAVDKTAKKVTKALHSIKTILDTSLATTQEIHKKSTVFLPKFTRINNCVKLQPNGSSSQTAINIFASKVTPINETLNNNMVLAESAINKLYTVVEKIENDLSPIAEIQAEIKKFEEPLSEINKVLQQLKNDLLSIKIKIDGVEITLYDVFNDFEQVFDAAMAPIQFLVDALIHAIEKQLPAIPGLKWLEDLTIAVPTIPNLNLDFDALELEFKTFKVECS